MSNWKTCDTKVRGLRRPSPPSSLAKSATSEDPTKAPFCCGTDIAPRAWLKIILKNISSEIAELLGQIDMPLGTSDLHIPVVGLDKLLGLLHGGCCAHPRKGDAAGIVGS